MGTSGMARKVDDLGRIVLPVEMRRLFGIGSGDSLQIDVDDRGIVLRKIETRCVFCGGTDGLRSYREKQLCSSCAAELRAPAAARVGVGGSDLGPPHAPEGVAVHRTEAPAVTGLPAPEPQRDVVDAPPWKG